MAEGLELFVCREHGLSPWAKDCPWCWWAGIVAKGEVVLAVVA